MTALSLSLNGLRKMNGACEVARRQRQIAEGRLTASNGVVFSM